MSLVFLGALHPTDLRPVADLFTIYLVRLDSECRINWYKAMLRRNGCENPNVVHADSTNIYYYYLFFNAYLTRDYMGWYLPD